MEIFLIRLLQFMLAISLLVLFHEGGHFFFSKLFKVRVEKFYLFFDPWFHLFEFKPKHSDTTYGVGWLPLGGYCKIAGMIDESFDTDQMAKPAEDWEFRSKPAWQRLFIMIGGVLVNLILALIIYAMVLFYWGDVFIPVKNMNLGMKFNTEAKSYGFKDGDILLGSENGEFKDMSGDLFREISQAKEVYVMRDGKQETIKLPGDLNLLNMIQSKPAFAMPFIPNRIDSVMKDSPAGKIGVEKGDKIIAINGKTVDSWNEINLELSKLAVVLESAETHEDSMKVRNTSIVLAKADGVRDTSNITLSPQLQLGIYYPSIKALYKPIKVEYSFLESIPAGASYGFHVLGGYVNDMKYVFTSEGAKSLGGFGAIGSLFPPVWDWMMFWKMTAFLSIILAFMNILPIPALDGGHVLFLCYEIITRRKPSEAFMIRAEYVGIAILMLLMIVANMNDILRWLGYM